MAAGKLLYAQSGGVSAVINATAAGVIETARDKGIPVYAARNGILGALREELIDTTKEAKANIAGLKHTPGGAFGSCRYKLKSLEENRAEYERLIAVFKAHDIRTFLYNGGNDSADTANKVSKIGHALGYEVNCIGVPKTIDNDLVVTDNCPGFGSVAKYTAIAVREASLDVASMMDTSTKVFIIEVMGRHAGWIAAAAGLAGSKAGDPPQIILFPENVFDPAAFLAKVKATVEKVGYCTVVVSEGVKGSDGKFLAESAETGARDAFGHAQLGGAAPVLAALVKEKLGYKYHWALPDYLQRSARHIAAKVDVEQAYAVGKKAVEYAADGLNAVMPVIVRTSDEPYKWKIEAAPLDKIANQEKKMPKNFISKDGFGITAAARRYLAPLILGEAPPPYGEDGLPQYVTLKNTAVPKKLKKFVPA
ncbi:6-phosphofructokinase [Luteibacter aegosomaticola]|jgi:ATP-dependent phosphofructokinase / diphosphate-dependent phosphofructokinase|uniref:6-phosphofructokinase n=1 Tax=Luteibacter aegosomaticola TaxID=2911538 RepID=UPI001FF74353|nr:6-phosphofructokinase [Luteibacter aegosomaticola]UPG89582.1 6-phosphofructokinase [Luteibacter aegosomaticola]